MRLVSPALLMLCAALSLTTACSSCDDASGRPAPPLTPGDMTPDAEITAAFWKHLRSDRTVMLGLEASAPTTLRPMTAQLDAETDQGPIWFFTSRDNTIVQKLGAGQGNRAIATFTSKGHDLFACISGTLVRESDRTVLDKLWNNGIAAWYEGGKDDPKLALLRFDAEHAEIWLNEHSLLAGVKMLLGVDPKEDYQDKVAEVNLRG